MVPENIKHFIGGREARSSYAKTFGAPDPATGKEYSRVEVGVGGDINQAVLAALAALEADPWPGLPAAERAGMLDRIADGIESRAGQIADFEALGTGLPVTQAREQARRADGCFRRAATVIVAGHTDNPTFSTGPVRYPLRRPAGVAGVITSWRAPFLTQARAIAPALAAGCTVVLHVDPWAPLSAALLPEITTEAGLPGGVLNIVHGTGNWQGTPGAGTGSAGAGAAGALVSHPGVPVLWFAGDATAGEQVARDAAAHGKRLSADLAGNSPCVIFADADLDRAVDSALFGAFALNGVRRTATSRILAEGSVYEAVVARLAEGASRLRVGSPADPATEVGPLVHAEHYDRVMSGVRRGVRDGARLAAGGRRPAGLAEGNYLSATVLADVTPEMRIFQEVISAPVACVTSFDTEEEAVTLASAIAGDGATYLWTSDPHRAYRLALAINSPMTWANSHNPGDLRSASPAESGEHGPDLLAFYTRSSAIHISTDDGPAPRLAG